MTSRRSGGILVILVLAALAASARADAPPEPAPRKNPASPERILLTVTVDPARSQVVTWRTRVYVADPVAQIAPARAEANFHEKAVSVKAVSESLKTDKGETVYHHVALFRDLAPDTAYCYRVGGGKAWSEWFTIRTASETPDPFRFLFIGDMQNGIFSHCSRTVRQAFRRAPDARLVLFAGDLVAEGYDDALWGEFCDALGFIGSETAVMASPGNHDMHALPDWITVKKMDSAAPTWRAHFCFPANAPEGITELKDEAFFFDYQGVRFISLSTAVFSSSAFREEKREAIRKAQLAWLEGLLGRNHSRWVVVLMHYPVYSAGKDRDNPEMRDLLLPLFDKYGVDLVLQGHDHVYARTRKLHGGKVAEPSAPGTVYVISAGGFKTYPVNPRYRDLMAVLDSGKQYYQVIDVSPERLEYRSYAVDGRLNDAFRLEKGSTGPSSFIELSGERGGKPKPGGKDTAPEAAQPGRPAA